MMLPEHVTMLQKQKRNEWKKAKPLLDIQVIEELEFKIQTLYKQGKEAVIIVFGAFENDVYEGRIVTIDSFMGRVKIIKNSEEAYSWINFDTIIGIEEK